MIESLTIKKVATYDDVGVQIENLNKVNFIYGANGTGKTTISRFIDVQSESYFGDCSLNWKNDIPLQTLVYNKEFRNQNFGKGSIAGVFTLGKATKEEIEAIEKKETQLEQIESEGLKKKDTLEKQQQEKDKTEHEFKENVWINIYKKNEAHFREAFAGLRTKERFKTKLICEFSNNQNELKEKDELIERSKIIFGTRPEHIDPISNIDSTRLIEIEEISIWQKKIIGKADIEISKIIQQLNINDWVYEGKGYLQDDNETCPFCQQNTITKEFRNQLENYFDESFTTDINLIKKLSEEYKRLAENIENQLYQIETIEKEKDTSKLDIDKFSVRLKTLSGQFAANRERLLKKEQEPSRSIEFVSINEQFTEITYLISTANTRITEHNQIVNNYNTEKANLINDIWKYLIEENRQKIEGFLHRSNDFQRSIDNITNQKNKLKVEYRKLQNEIREDTKNVTSIKPTIDEINGILRSYGFQNFKIVPSEPEENHYQIEREDGTSAESTLSEGEITFITFLYFLQLTKGSTTEENVTDDRVLVIDDPISSLDSNVLFIVSSLIINEIIKPIRSNQGNIKQLILLTHNVYFHKEVSFIDGRTREIGNTHYWILRKKNNCSCLQFYKLENPVQNSYELLWQELKNREHNSALTIQNTMRRIIEHYFKLLGKYGDDDLINKFNTGQDQEICLSLIRWINDGSHSIPDDLYLEQQDDIIDKYFEVFKKIFEETDHIEHFNMMMKNTKV
ncbi:MAG: AAA family ATPase [Ekhidna sp.]|nr:AAA family ATPase [Ekhidna sp.]